MKNNYTREEVNSLLNEYSDIWNISNLDEFKRENGLIPSHEVGKVYSCNLNNTFIIKSIEGDRAIIFGFNAVGNWEERGSILLLNINKLGEITQDTWMDDLTEEAKKRGHKGMFMIRSGGTGLACNNVEIMLNGVWFKDENTELTELKNKYKDLGDVIEKLENR